MPHSEFSRFTYSEVIGKPGVHARVLATRSADLRKLPLSVVTQQHQTKRPRGSVRVAAASTRAHYALTRYGKRSCDTSTLASRRSAPKSARPVPLLRLLQTPRVADVAAPTTQPSPSASPIPSPLNKPSPPSSRNL